MMLPRHKKRTARTGFTLVEVGIVVLILFLFASIILIALDPPEKFRRLRNRQRQRDIETIANAMTLYVHDNGSPIVTLPPQLLAENTLQFLVGVGLPPPPHNADGTTPLFDLMEWINLSSKVSHAFNPIKSKYVMITNDYNGLCSAPCAGLPQENDQSSALITLCADLSILVENGYLPRIPMDPQIHDLPEELDYDLALNPSLYAISWDRELQVVACNPEPEGNNNELPYLHVIR